MISHTSQKRLTRLSVSALEKHIQELHTRISQLERDVHAFSKRLMEQIDRAALARIRDKIATKKQKPHT